MLTTGREGAAECLPIVDILRHEILCCEGLQTRRGSGDNADRAREHQGGRCDFAPGRPPLMVAMGTKELFQGIIGPGQLRDIITMKEAWPVAPRDFEEVGQRWGERPRSRPVPTESPQQATETALHGRSRLLWLVGEYLRDAMHPGVGSPYVRP